MARRINVIFGDNGSGLTRDALVLRDTLERAGHVVSLTALPPRRYPLSLRYAPEWARHVCRAGRHHVRYIRAIRLRPWDVNIFLERLVPSYFPAARTNWFFPNQEWLSSKDHERLKDVDLILFKTREAFELLSSATTCARYVGFRSMDRRVDLSSRREAAIHVSGWNPHKGTETLLRAWHGHSRWPHLSVVSQLALPVVDAANITLLGTRISDRRLRTLQNECAVHVCPSEVEGFGHTIGEALSCGAVVVTTDAPPMNELITPDEGVLVPYASTAPMKSGTRYYVDREQLVVALRRVWAMSTGMRNRLAVAARARFERMSSEFDRNLTQLVADL